MSKQVRLGVIGCGGMARSHMGYFKNVTGLQFTAAADNAPAALERTVKEYGVTGFADGHELIKSGLCDAVLIATPHYFHPTYSIAAFKAGLHVLTEKPVAVTAKAADEANKAHRKHKHLIYAAMFQQRTAPGWRKVKQMIDAGELGQITRVNWIITNWFRTQAYYDSGGWRATWAGEGGGVLINQCPHNLDLIQWFVGMPKRVTAVVGLGKHHHIEVEDDVTAILEYPNGATGVFVTTTADSPGTNRLEITGERGKLIADGSNRLEFHRTTVPVSQFLKESNESFANPPVDKITIEAGGKGGSHQEVTQAFVNAILHGTPLVAEAEEGIHGLELGNAMLMSGVLGKPIDIPTPREQFEKLLQKLARTSKFKKGAVREAKADLSASFK